MDRVTAQVARSQNSEFRSQNEDAGNEIYSEFWLLNSVYLSSYWI